jgi:hypothetical protein
MRRSVRAALTVAALGALALGVPAASAYASTTGTAAPATVGAPASTDGWFGYYSYLEACVAEGNHQVVTGNASNYTCVYEAFPYGMYHLWLDQSV